MNPRPSLLAHAASWSFLLGGLVGQADPSAPAVPIPPELIPVHTAASDHGQPYGIWAAGTAYKASFHDGMHFVPYLGSKAPRNLPVGWRTRSVRLGDAELATRAAGVPTYAGYHVEYDLGRATEAYDVRADGLEQTFVIPRRLAEGALVITGEVSTELHQMPASDGTGGIGFADDQGRLIVSYGAATAVDADGRQQPMTTAWQEGRVVLTLDAEWLAGARFPVVVDPLIGSHTAVSGGEVGAVDIAKDPSNGGLLWVAYSRVVSAADHDVYVRRIVTSFVTDLLFVDSTASWSSFDPTIAFVVPASSSVAAFTREFGTGERHVRWHKHGSADLVQSTAYGSLPSSNTNEWRPAVGGVRNGAAAARAMIAYQLENVPGAFYNGTQSDIHGCAIDLATPGQGTAGTPFVIASAPLTENERPAIQEMAGGSGLWSWHVAYQSVVTFGIGITPLWEVKLRRVTATGPNGPAVTLDAGATSLHRMAPKLAGDDTRLLVAFTAGTVAQLGSRPYDANGHSIRLVRVDWDRLGSAPSEPHGTNTLLSATTPRLLLTDVGYDTFTKSHWAVGFRSSDTDNLYLRTVGYTGSELTAAVVHTAGTATTVGGGITFDEFSRTHLLGFGVNQAGIGDVVWNGWAPPSLVAPLRQGIGCSAATIGWAGYPQVGSEFCGLEVTGAPSASLHVAIAAFAPTNQLLSGIPEVQQGCWLLVPNIGPDFLAVLNIQIGDSAFWPLPLPEYLPPMTLYFQGFHTDGVNLPVSSTQRLVVPIAK